MKQKTDLVLTNTSPRACTEVKIIADHEREPTESFAVALVTLHTRTVTLKPQFAFVTILDDDNKGKRAKVNSSLGLRFQEKCGLAILQAIVSQKCICGCPE